MDGDEHINTRGKSQWQPPTPTVRLRVDHIQSLLKEAAVCGHRSWERHFWLEGRDADPRYDKRPSNRTDQQIAKEMESFDVRAEELTRQAAFAAWHHFFEKTRRKPGWLRLHDWAEDAFGITLLWRRRAEMWYLAVAKGFAEWLNANPQSEWTASIPAAGSAHFSITTLQALGDDWDWEAKRFLASWLMSQGFDLTEHDITNRLSTYVCVGRRRASATRCARTAAR